MGPRRPPHSPPPPPPANPLSTSPEHLPAGLYERLLDEDLAAAFAANPGLRPLLRKVDDEEAPALEAAQIAQLIEPVLRGLRKTEHRRDLLRRLVDLLAATDGFDYLQRRRLVDVEKPLLETIPPEIAFGKGDFPRPETPLYTSSLFTGSPGDPPLDRELRNEMMSADQVDMLVAFIKWSGLRLLMPAFKDLAERGVQVRVVTTSYMGASDAEALLWLARQPGFQVRVSYDTQHTRLHAKAYRFVRRSGFSTAYIGSANISESAMTRGLEWTVKITQQDQRNLMARFEAEFETYWQSPDFEKLSEDLAPRLRRELNRARAQPGDGGRYFFADIEPKPFQAAILETLENRRAVGDLRGLVVAATGTGKTVIAAFDYKAFCSGTRGPRPKLLFVAHREEILHQARDCFRTVLRDPNFGDLLVGGREPEGSNHLFASVQSLASRCPWESLGAGFYDYVVVDEVHHSPADTYSPLFRILKPKFLLGLTATPERMDGASILPFFDSRMVSEIRLPDALEARLLCPFHYFGVTDPISLEEERFWSNGKYSIAALEEAYTGDDIRARQRLDVIFDALHNYLPDLDEVRAVGFCVSVRHAHYMAAAFRTQGLTAEALVGETPAEDRKQRMQDFRSGTLRFLFTVDVLAEGVDVPEINLVMFLRPTESLTVFLQQLGRGLRHAPGKDVVTVLDFVGQNHRRYRIDRKFSALLGKHRHRIDQEVEREFPHLPPGCSIVLERQAREHVLQQIRENLKNFSEYVRESLRTFEAQHGIPLTFANFVRCADISPAELLAKQTWSAWKAKENLAPAPAVSSFTLKIFERLLMREDDRLLADIKDWSSRAVDEPGALYSCDPDRARLIHFALYSKEGSRVSDFQSAARELAEVPQLASDITEVIEYSREHSLAWKDPELGYDCPLGLHSSYGSEEIKAAFGIADLAKHGPTGVGVLRDEVRKAYIHLVTFNKSEKDFEPSTRYQDYPISPTLLHWQSQSNTSAASPTGQNYLHFIERGYTILFFARMTKRDDFNRSVPFTFLGSALRHTRFEGERPITIVWELKHPMPAWLFDQARRA